MTHGAHDWPFSPPPALFPGFSPIPNVISPGPIVIPAEGSVSIQGPPTNERLRVLMGIVLNGTGAGAASVTVSLQPAGLILGRALAPIAGGISLILPSTSFVSQIILGVGESILFTNTAVNACEAWFGYYDIPSVGRTLVRTTVVDATDVTIIPAAPAGSVRRWLFPYNSSNSAPNCRSSLIVFNDDTAAIVVRMLKGGSDLIVRSGAVGVGTTAPLQAGYFDLTCDSTAAISIGLAAAVATRPVPILACWEESPAP